MIPLRGWVVVALATVGLWTFLANLPAVPAPKLTKFTWDYQLVLKPGHTVETVKVPKEVVAEKPPVHYAADEFPKVNRENKRGRADWAPPYFGNVLSFDRSKVI